jgi:ATP-binding cassette subfamily B (MDR/TAP) protein 1
MKADNIIVLKKGKVVQQGTHAELMADPEGAYWALANAQQLTMSKEDEVSGVEWIDFERNSIDTTVLELEKFSTEIERQINGEYEYEPDYVQRGFMGSFGNLLWEQRPYWPWYTLMLLATIGAGGEC